MAYDAEVIDSKNRAFATDIKSAAYGALGQLESAALGIAFSFANYTTRTIEEIGALDKVNISELPTVQEVMGTIQDIHPDQFPQAPTSDELVKYKKHVWEASQLDAIESLLMNYIDTMGMPSQAFQDSIFNEDRERKQRILADKLDVVAAVTSGKGFKYANLQTAALIKDAIDQHGDNLEELNRKVTQLMTDWARQNLHFAIQQGIAVEQAHMEFAYKYSSIFKDIYTTIITSILEKYRVQVTMELAKIEAITKTAMLRGDLQKVNADISSTEATLKLNRSKLEIDQALSVFKSTIEDIKNRGTLQVEAASKRAIVSGELMKAVSSSVLALVKSQ